MIEQIKAPTSVSDFPQQPIFLAAKAGRFSLLALDDPDTRLRRGFVDRVAEPCLAVLAANVGPGRTHAAKPLRGWAAAAIVHAIPEDRRDYEMIAAAVGKSRRLLLVETVPALALSWLAFLEHHVPVTIRLVPLGRSK